MRAMKEASARFMQPDSLNPSFFVPSADECARAARAHRAAWLGLLPLFGVFTALGIYNRQQSRSPWVAQQALLSALFQIVAFNFLMIVATIAGVVGFAVWESDRDGGALAQAIFLSILPFVVLYYVVQGLIATRAARVVARGEHFRYPLLERLVGPPAPTAVEIVRT